jgi:hypothetical protein
VLKNSQEHEEQQGCQAPRGWSAATSRTICSDLADGPQVRISTAEEYEKQPQTSDRQIYQTTRSLETKFCGDDEHPKVKICHKNYGV